MSHDVVIVLPGGGYRHHADHEAEPVAAWLQTLGLDAHVFRYPVSTRHPAVLDAVRAEVAAARAAGADRVALLGFSAGGHAAGHAAYAPGGRDEHRVDAVILGYPVVSMLLDTHAGSRHELLGADADDDAELRAATSVDQLVGAGPTPPAFIWHTADDAVVPVQHAYLLGMALAAAEVPHALHVYPHGRHGLGLAAGEPGAQEWIGVCAQWLHELGWTD